MINRSVLTGRLTKDPEVQYTQSGTPVLSFILAVDRQFRDKQGNREADFVNCVIWRKAAENFANFTHKGSLVGIDGHIQTRNYENNQGQRVYVTEVIVEHFSLLEPKLKGQQPGPNNRSQGGYNQNGQYNQGGQQQQNQNNQQGNYGSQGSYSQQQQQPNGGYPQDGYGYGH